MNMKDFVFVYFICLLFFFPHPYAAKTERIFYQIENGNVLNEKLRRLVIDGVCTCPLTILEYVGTSKLKHMIDT